MADRFADYWQSMNTGERLTPNEANMTEAEHYLMPVEGPGFFERQYDRIVATMAQPGDEMSRTLFRNLAEIPENFKLGLVRSSYDYQVAAQNVAEYVADKVGLPFDKKQDFLAASLEKYKNIPMQPTSEEWEDQLFYLLGNLAPDILLTFTGGGIVGAAAKNGAMAVGMGKKAGAVTTMFGRIVGDTAANVGTFLAHEAGQAEIDGREADYAGAAKDALAMSAMMATIGRTSQALGLKRRYGAVLTGSAMGGVAATSGADDNAIAANVIMGSLFGLGVSNGKTGPVDITKWVVAQKRMGRPVDFKSYLKEFQPVKYNALYVDEVNKDAMVHKTGVDQLDPKFLSPRDNFMLFLRAASGKDVFGYSDDQLIHLMADVAEQTGGQYSMMPGTKISPNERLIPSFAREETLQNAKIVMDSVNETNKVWLNDHPNYNSWYTNADWKARKPAHRKTLTRAVEEEGKNYDMLGDPVIKTDVEGNVAFNGKTGLKLHELSKREVKELFGFAEKVKPNTDAARWNEGLFKLHRQAIEGSAKNFEAGNKKTYPHMGALIDYDMFPEYGYIHRATKFREAANTIDDFAGKTAELKEKVIETKNAGNAALDWAEAETKQGIVDTLYRGLVATEGRLYNKLEKENALNVRNAHQLRYTIKDKVAARFDELDQHMEWHNWDKDYRAWFDLYYKLETEPDFAQRRGAFPEVARQMWEGVEAPQAEVMKHYVLENVKNYAGGKDLFLKRIDSVKHEFSKVFDEMLDQKLISQKTWDRLQQFKYIPQKTIEEIRDNAYFFNIGMRRTTGGEPDLVSSEAKFIKNLSEFAGKNQFIDTEYLLKNHMAMLQHKIAKNSFLLEASKMPVNDMFKTQKPGAKDKKKANYQQYTFVEDGKEKTIWVEGRIANLLEKQDIFSDQSSRHWMGWLSGAHAIRLTAVGVNPIFAMATHPLDILHTFTHHRALSKFAPKLLWDFEVYNRERGFLPFLQNFKSAWTKDKVFRDYVENNGTTATLISHISNQELIRGARQGMVEGRVSNSYARSYNNFLEFFGKFGHSMEIATRMTEVDMLMSTGKFGNKAEATAESLRRLNYHRRGYAMKFIDTVIPFANSAAQILASNTSELKNIKNAGRTMAIMGQVTFGLAMHRAMMEEEYPGFYQDIPWEDRMRYWIIPTPMTTVDSESGENRKVYFKIKKAYNPYFGLMDAVATAAMDKHYYGTDGMPPLDYLTMVYDAIKVSTPAELRSIIPPAANALGALGYNTDLTGRPVYKGPEVELKDEINTKLTGGRETHGAFIRLGELTGGSPARMQEAAGSYFAANPLSYFVGVPFEVPTETQKSAVDNMLKFAGSRRFMGATRPGWRDWKAGEKFAKQAGSIERKNLTSQVEGAILRFHANEITPRQMYLEITSATQDDKESQLKAIALGKREIKSRTYLNKLIKAHGEAEVYDNIPTHIWWAMLRNNPRGQQQAEMYYNEWIQLEPFWQKELQRLAAYGGYFKDPFFIQALKKLKRKGDKL